MTKLLLFAALIAIVAYVQPPTKPVDFFCFTFAFGCLGVGVWSYLRKHNV